MKRQGLQECTWMNQVRGNDRTNSELKFSHFTPIDQSGFKHAALEITSADIFSV